MRFLERWMVVRRLIEELGGQAVAMLCVGMGALVCALGYAALTAIGVVG